MSGGTAPSARRSASPAPLSMPLAEYLSCRSLRCQDSVLRLRNGSAPCGTLRKTPPAFSAAAACISRKPRGTSNTSRRLKYALQGLSAACRWASAFRIFRAAPRTYPPFFRHAVHIHDLILLQEIQHFCRRFQIVDGGITARLSRLLLPRKDTLYHLCKSGRIGVRRFLFQPALQLGNAGFQLPQLLICDFDFAVDVSPLRADSALLHLKGGYAQMNGGDQVYSLPLIAAVVYTLGMISLFKIRIADFSPRRPPFLRFGLLVPVGGGNGFAFVLPLFGL